MKRTKPKRGYSLFITITTVILLSCISIYKKIDIKSQNDILISKQEELQKKIEDENERTLELEKKKEYIKSKEFIEETARDKLGLVYKDEIIFEPNEK